MKSLYDLMHKCVVSTDSKEGPSSGLVIGHWSVCPWSGYRNGSIEILWTWVYVGFSQVILGCNRLLQLEAQLLMANLSNMLVTLLIEQ